MFGRRGRTTQRAAALDEALIGLVELSPRGLKVCADGRNIAEELGRNIHSLLGTPIAKNQKALESLGLEDAPLDEVRRRLDAFEIALAGVGARRCVQISLTIERAFTERTFGYSVNAPAQPDEPAYSYVLTLEQIRTLGYVPM